MKNLLAVPSEIEIKDQFDDGIELATPANENVQCEELCEKKGENWLTFRKREALLSRISIYIVFMFIFIENNTLSAFIFYLVSFDT